MRAEWPERALGHEASWFLVSDIVSASRVWMQIVSDMLQRPLQARTYRDLYVGLSAT